MVFEVEKFLGFMKLETGGFIISWTLLILSILFLIDIIRDIFRCARFETFADMFSGLLSIEYYNKDCTIWPKIVYSAVYLGLLSIPTVSAFFAIKGIRNRNHKNLVALLVFMLVGTLLQLSDLSRSYYYLLIFGYLLIVLYSLYAVFKREYKIALLVEDQPIILETVA